MSLLESARIALRALVANKLRAALTMLGMIIGVAAVITLMSAGQAVQDFVTGQFRSLGTNLLFVTPGRSEGGGPGEGNATTPATLTNGDARALLNPALAPDVEAVSPALSGSAIVTHSGDSQTISVTGVAPEYSAMRNVEVAAGDFITGDDLASGSRVAVLGPDVVAELFPDNSLPLGATIRINDAAFKVIGVTQTKGGTPFGNDDNAIFIPLTTAQMRVFPSRGSRGDFEVSQIIVQAVSPERMDAAADQVRAILRQQHDIAFGGDDDFSVINQADLLSSLEQVLGTLTVFLGAIAAISLLVGGIGIMNIMLVSVTERTREIGLRKAVGARRRDILTQFLVESVVLAVVGGTVGVVLGGLGAQALRLFSPDLQPGLSLDSVLLATSFSAGVGLFFGIYPAMRAAALDPIAALRYE